MSPDEGCKIIEWNASPVPIVLSADGVKPNPDDILRALPNGRVQRIDPFCALRRMRKGKLTVLILGVMGAIGWPLDKPAK